MTPSRDNLAAVIRDVMVEHDDDIAPIATQLVLPVYGQRRQWPVRSLAVAATTAVLVTGGMVAVSTAFHSNGVTNAAPSPSLTHQLAVPLKRTPMLASSLTEAKPNDAVGTAGSITADGVIRFRGIIITVPAEWVHNSYSTPCGTPMTDYAWVVTQAAGPVAQCAPILAQPISGIIVASLANAETWMDIAVAVHPVQVNELSGLTGMDRAGDTVVVLPEVGVGFVIHATSTIRSNVIKSIEKSP